MRSRSCVCVNSDFWQRPLSVASCLSFVGKRYAARLVENRQGHFDRGRLLLLDGAGSHNPDDLYR